MPLNWTGTQPLGLAELEGNVAIRCDEVRCCVRGCNQWLARRRRGINNPNINCPCHGISVSTSPTYIYEDYRRNFIIDVDLLANVMSLKVESWRLGNERSEDALSWNVFMGLSGLGELKSAFHSLTGIQIDNEPELYLWGVKVPSEQPQTWPRLIEVRQALENRPGLPTEPDIILRVPGEAIVLIEAKFGSANGTMEGYEERFGAVAEFLNRYPCIEGAVDPLNRAWIEEQPPGKVLQQLVRNVIFAQWLAEDGAVPHVVNLVRATEETDVSERMAAHLGPNGPVSFHRATWEDLYRLPVLSGDDAKPLRQYLGNKTNRLAKAFQI